MAGRHFQSSLNLETMLMWGRSVSGRMKTEALLIPEEWIIHPEAELLPVHIMRGGSQNLIFWRERGVLRLVIILRLKISSGIVPV